jgi:DNA-binding winged helix-turn-helix (wHTH) protein/TolB-like protein/Flp pilus assembly protein TadD
MNVPAKSSVRFADFELDLNTGELRSNGDNTYLQEKPLQVLSLLLERPGQLVTREQLVKQLWADGTFVDFDQSLNKAVNRLRKALGDSADHPQFIETVPRRGYRFICKIERPAAPAMGPGPALVFSRAGTEMNSRILMHASLGALLLVISLGVWRIATHGLTSSPSVTYVTRGGSASSTAIAVLPLQNPSSNDKESDFLRFALADEIATALSRVPSFSVRPFATTSRYSSPGLDLQQAGHEMGVASIVTGDFLTEGDRLEVTLEAVDVETNRTLWRETVRVVASDRIAMREQITTKVRQALIPVLGGSFPTAGRDTHPTSEQAYSLYLRSVAVPHDVGPNKTAIEMLERAVRIDPGYAPAWEALGLRYYFDATYADGGERNLTSSDSADERALALDPNLIFAGATLATNLADEGNIGTALAQASALVKERPESAQAHFALAYVERYAGALDESARECERALTLDRGNYQFRSCALTFLELDQPQRAMDFVHLDSGSEWAASRASYTFLQEGKLTEARQTMAQVGSGALWGKELIEACLDPIQAPSLANIANKTETAALAANDAEIRYLIGRLLAYCGQEDQALRTLKSAIRNYCAHTALETDLCSQICAAIPNSIN